MQPDVNVARLAREHGINDNLLFNWRHQYKRGKLLRTDSPAAELLPVSIVSPPVVPAPRTTPLPDDTTPLRSGVTRLHGKTARSSHSFVVAYVAQRAERGTPMIMPPAGMGANSLSLKHGACVADIMLAETRRHG